MNCGCNGEGNRQRRKNALALSLACAAMSAQVPVAVHAEGNPVAGREKAQQCVACHGEDGMSIDPAYPNLAGQHESYLIKAMSDYRSGARDNAIMKSFAANLTNQDIEDLAAWYASLEGLVDLSIK